MKHLLFLFAASLCTLTPLEGFAQTENPRGIYKMTTLVGKVGEINAPFDQYKICTDSVTLTVSIANNVCHIGNTDHKVFNYTGEQPKSEDDKSTLIYDSNAEHFSLKWWSTTPYHLYFPTNDWCIEKYEANKFSEEGKKAFDLLNGKVEEDAKNPFIGIWNVLGSVDELRDVKRDLPKLREKPAFPCTYIIFTPHDMAYITKMFLNTNPLEYPDKKTIKNGEKTRRVKWLSKNLIALEMQIGYRTDWQILERMTDGSTPLSHIVEEYVRTADTDRPQQIQFPME